MVFIYRWSLQQVWLYLQCACTCIKTITLHNISHTPLCCGMNMYTTARNTHTLYAPLITVKYTLYNIWHQSFSLFMEWLSRCPVCVQTSALRVHVAALWSETSNSSTRTLIEHLKTRHGMPTATVQTGVLAEKKISELYRLVKLQYLTHTPW